ncbi:MAG: 2-hydroxychromene-2-carboxylate isomerase [Gammaproteobacteria bacterium]
METAEFYYDYISPYGYLVNTQLPTSGLSINYRTISILEVMAQVGNQPSPKCPPKMSYAMDDTQRWARRYGVPLEVNGQWWDAVMGGTLSMKLFAGGALVTQRDGGFEAYHKAVWEAIWGRPRDVVTPVGRAALLDELGLPGQTIWEEAASPEIVKKLDESNELAASRGVFGVPTFFVGNDMFFGNDRLEFVKERAQRTGIFA